MYAAQPHATWLLASMSISLLTLQHVHENRSGMLMLVMSEVFLQMLPWLICFDIATCTWTSQWHDNFGHERSLHTDVAMIDLALAHDKNVSAMVQDDQRAWCFVHIAHWIAVFLDRALLVPRAGRVSYFKYNRTSQAIRVATETGVVVVLLCLVGHASYMIICRCLAVNIRFGSLTSVLDFFHLLLLVRFF